MFGYFYFSLFCNHHDYNYLIILVTSQKAKAHCDAITILGQAASQSEGSVIGVGMLIPVLDQVKACSNTLCDNG